MAILQYTYYPEIKSGRAFFGSTAASGVALPISTGTAVTFGIWNTDPGKVMIPLWFSVGYASGNIVASQVGFASQAVGLIGGATGLPISAYAAGTSKNSLIGSGLNSTTTFIPATATLTAGNASGSPVYYTGISFNAASTFEATHDFFGRIVIEPGQLFFACANAAQTALLSMAIAWSEVPIASM